MASVSVATRTLTAASLSLSTTLVSPTPTAVAEIKLPQVGNYVLTSFHLSTTCLSKLQLVQDGSFLSVLYPVFGSEQHNYNNHYATATSSQSATQAISSTILPINQIQCSTEPEDSITRFNQEVGTLTSFSLIATLQSDICQFYYAFDGGLGAVCGGERAATVCNKEAGLECRQGVCVPSYIETVRTTILPNTTSATRVSTSDYTNTTSTLGTRSAAPTATGSKIDSNNETTRRVASTQASVPDSTSTSSSRT
ncbi:hypothetical protein BCR33DRAFT_715485 [Rhizoclosmatium globosum]|uniref:Uncharacterized protein n=1 Tax=Rhizoclosmatium globosum TaxID=329046 RepID=A0A1Y2CH90_9FUNG|nr:hypothetical protein BCR33DRAFT_715485 [Rhizoclosmatium globosum]|eukprot:ORY46382.1 hypothetical protein BCR33DRAFT_715485 [Rhizoclosmatium globosum]